MVTQRYRVEKFSATGAFHGQDHVMAWTQSDAELRGQKLMNAPPFRERFPNEPYIHVTLCPEREAADTCSRCGEPRYRCGGESDPHE